MYENVYWNNEFIDKECVAFLSVPTERLCFANCVALLRCPCH
jgi:hypothetical protein